MGSLRWILLLIGLLCLVALTLWEKRRPRQGSEDGLERSERTEPSLGQGLDRSAPGETARARLPRGASVSAPWRHPWYRCRPLNQSPMCRS